MKAGSGSPPTCGEAQCRLRTGRPRILGFDELSDPRETRVALLPRSEPRRALPPRGGHAGQPSRDHPVRDRLGETVTVEVGEETAVVQELGSERRVIDVGHEKGG